MTLKDRAGGAVPISDATFALAFRDLEDDILCLSHMSNIANSMVNEALYGRTTSAGDGMVSVLLAEDFRERFSFAVNNVAVRADALRDDMRAAFGESRT